MRDLYLRAVHETCVGALRDFMEQVGSHEVVIGLSGGIDSSVVAALACDALGCEHVHGVMLPGPYSSTHSITDAEALAHNLGISCATISISDAYEAFSKALAGVLGHPLRGLASENTQARCRMVCLMALSNTYGWIVLNTGNLSESATGYSTLYGDTAGAFAPIGGLYKTEVYELARFLNEVAREAGRPEPIPRSIIEKPPSAELSADQYDEDALGITYAELDRILYALYGHGTSSAPLEGDDDPDMIERVRRLYEASAFKRALEPPYPDMGACVRSCER